MNDDLTDQIPTKKFYITHRVQYEETDAMGVVYHGNYIRYMDHARTEWLYALGFTPTTMAFAVRRIAVEYRKPARLGERLRISAQVSRNGRNSLHADHSITGENGDLLCHGDVTLVHLDPESWQPRRLPENLLSVLQEITDPDAAVSPPERDAGATGLPVSRTEKIRPA